MKKCSLFVIIWTMGFGAAAQTDPVSWQGVADSLTHRIALRQIDSLTNAFNRMADSINTEYRSVISKIDAKAQAVHSAMDSLRSGNLPIGTLEKALDSLNQIRRDAEVKF